MDYVYGDSSPDIGQWQRQVAARGLLPASGHLGPATLAVICRVQQLNGRPVTGVLGPLTWSMPWTGQIG